MYGAKADMMIILKWEVNYMRMHGLDFSGLGQNPMTLWSWHKVAGSIKFGGRANLLAL